VRYNRVFGYYIEVSKSNLSAVPNDYLRKQTIAGGERFVTPALKEYEEKCSARTSGFSTASSRSSRPFAPGLPRRPRAFRRRRAPSVRSTCLAALARGRGGQQLHQAPRARRR